VRYLPNGSAGDGADKTCSKPLTPNLARNWAAYRRRLVVQEHATGKLPSMFGVCGLSLGAGQNPYGAHIDEGIKRSLRSRGSVLDGADKAERRERVHWASANLNCKPSSKIISSSREQWALEMHMVRYPRNVTIHGSSIISGPTLASVIRAVSESSRRSRSAHRFQVGGMCLGG
jgi:hypothetical protein